MLPKAFYSSTEKLYPSPRMVFRYAVMQLMGTLTGGIAHEFNNLLIPIMGYSGMILMEAEPESEIADSAGYEVRAFGNPKEAAENMGEEPFGFLRPFNPAGFPARRLWLRRRSGRSIRLPFLLLFPELFPKQGNEKKNKKDKRNPDGTGGYQEDE